MSCLAKFACSSNIQIFSASFIIHQCQKDRNFSQNQHNLFIHYFIHPSIHSLTHSHIHTFMHTHMHSFTHSLTHSLIHSCIFKFIHSFIHTFIYTLLHSHTRSFIHFKHLLSALSRNLLRVKSLRYELDFSKFYP